MMRTPNLDHFGTPCLCGSNRPSDECCAPYLRGEMLAPTAESLMRSRYVGYCVRDTQYLLNTWHPNTRPPQLEFSADDDTKWVGLTIVDQRLGLENDSHGEVAFEARYLNQAKVSILAERSRFERVNGAWLYVDGDLSPIQSFKVSRNDLCPCKSGKKFKKCCA